MKLTTVEVLDGDGGTKIINESDFDPKVHKKPGKSKSKSKKLATEE